ncbi:MAG: imelysin family protein [Bdellovibrionales bacterium]|nr:imelysin family protein [Bdellovibrionales bacterium]
MKKRIESLPLAKFVALGVLSAAMTTVVVGCGDFMNSAKAPAQGKTTPQGPRGTDRTATNPLPAELENPNEGAFSEAKMLVNIGVNVIAKSVEEFALEASVLERRLSAACAPLADGETPSVNEARWTDAREQWTRTMLAYHTVDAYPVGPLWANDKFLSSRIYAWPLFNPCGIDQETVRVREGIARDVPELPVPVRGLGALEYLMFETGYGTRCNARANPQVIEWTKKSVDEKRYDRCRYAVSLAKDVAAHAQTLQEEWNPKGLNYTKTLIDGSDSAMATLKDATNAVTDALYQLETLKDVRLARPLGLHKECASETGKCPQDAEHPYSGLAVRSIENRVAGFGAVFSGTTHDGKDGFGFDDLLVSKGHADIAARMKTAIQAALRSARGVDTSTAAVSEGSSRGMQYLIENMDKAECAATTISERKVELCAFFQDVRNVTTLLKAELLSVLSLRAPPTYQGDND